MRTVVRANAHEVAPNRHNEPATLIDKLFGRNTQAALGATVCRQGVKTAD
jgi:hypothetical protein